MKLLYCPHCRDIVRLHRHIRRCECGESWGSYFDGTDGVYEGTGMLIGIDNESLGKAMEKIPRLKGGNAVKFEAWIYSRLPYAVKTIHEMHFKGNAAVE